MKLYVTRHGETTWNEQNKICGRTDVPLTEKGRMQAVKLAEKLADANINLIISSPLSRAFDTAAFVALNKNIPIIKDDRLIEQNYGVFEGRHRKDQGFLNNKRQFAYKYPEGESMMMVAQRTYNLLDEIKNIYSDKNVLLVCHGGVCRVINTYFNDIKNEDFFLYEQENCEISQYNL